MAKQNNGTRTQKMTDRDWSVKRGETPPRRKLRDKLTYIKAFMLNPPVRGDRCAWSELKGFMAGEPANSFLGIFLSIDFEAKRALLGLSPKDSDPFTGDRSPRAEASGAKSNKPRLIPSGEAELFSFKVI